MQYVNASPVSSLLTQAKPKVILDSMFVSGEEVLPGGLPWVLKSDLDLIAHDKSPTALCVFLRKLAVEGGLADIDVEYHILVPKVLSAKEEPLVFFLTALVLCLYCV